MKIKIWAALAFVVVAVQFIPFGHDHSNPPTAGEPAWNSPQTRELFLRACGDCHSNQTSWPWYSNIAPVSWLVAHDVEEGRSHFNVSQWGSQPKNEGGDAAGELREGEMPPWFYLLPHPEAKLSDGQKQELVRGLTATFASESENHETQPESH